MVTERSITCYVTWPTIHHQHHIISKQQCLPSEVTQKRTQMGTKFATSRSTNTQSIVEAHYSITSQAKHQHLHLLKRILVTSNNRKQVRWEAPGLARVHEVQRGNQRFQNLQQYFSNHWPHCYFLFLLHFCNN